MSIYTVSYYRHDKKIIETKRVKADTTKLAVQRLLDTAKHHGTEISAISCTISGSRGVQRFCDTCQSNEAMYGYKDNKMLCEGCRK